MNIQTIYLGTFADDSTGDSLRAGGFKINDNFIELFSYGPARHRQALVLYQTLSSGTPSFLVNTGLNINLIAPLVATIGSGFEVRGERNAPLVITSNVSAAWVVPSNSTSYIYIQKDSLTANPVYGYSVYLPYKAQTSASSPNTDQHWFNTLRNQMYRWGGTSYDPVNRIFVAQVVTDNTSVQSLSYFTATEQSDAILTAINSLCASTLSYVNTKFATATADAHSYTDAALTSAKTYTDLQTSAYYLSAQAYADNSAKKYALIFG